MVYDYSKLNGKIREVFGSNGRFAQEMNMSERTLSLKINNKVYWKQPEISRACELLGIERDDIPTYFFTLEVPCA